MGLITAESKMFVSFSIPDINQGLITTQAKWATTEPQRPRAVCNLMENVSGDVHHWSTVSPDKATASAGPVEWVSVLKWSK